MSIVFASAGGSGLHSIEVIGFDTTLAFLSFLRALILSTISVVTLYLQERTSVHE